MSEGKKMLKTIITHVAVGVVMLLVGVSIGASGSQAETPSTPTPITKTPTPIPQAAPKAPKEESYPEGTYEVGVDIQPGKYVSRDNSDGCYWARLSANDDIKANDIRSGQSVVTIRKSDAKFETSGCNPWVRR